MILSVFTWRKYYGWKAKLCWTLRKSRHLVWRVDLDSSTDQDILIQFVVSIGLSVVDWGLSTRDRTWKYSSLLSHFGVSLRTDTTLESEILGKDKKTKGFSKHAQYHKKVEVSSSAAHFGIPIVKTFSLTADKKTRTCLHSSLKSIVCLSLNFDWNILPLQYTTYKQRLVHAS